MEPVPATPTPTPIPTPTPVPVQPPPAPPVPRLCPQCHVTVRPTDFFCYNCGKNLMPKPPETKPETLIMYYLGAIFLPPMGIIWGWKYVRQPDRKSQIHGAILIGITVIELIYLTFWSVDSVHTLNNQMNLQLNGLQGL